MSDPALRNIDDRTHRRLRPRTTSPMGRGPCLPLPLGTPRSCSSTNCAGEPLLNRILQPELCFEVDLCSLCKDELQIPHCKEELQILVCWGVSESRQASPTECPAEFTEKLMTEAVEVAVARMDKLSQHWSHPFRGGVDASSVKLCHDLPHVGSKLRQSCFVLLRAVGSIAIGCGPVGLRAQARQRSAGATESASCRGSREWRHHGFRKQGLDVLPELRSVRYGRC